MGYGYPQLFMSIINKFYSKFGPPLSPMGAGWQK